MVMGSQSGEQIYCRTLFSDPCEGWLALSSGLAAEQQWYIGGFPQTQAPLQGVRTLERTDMCCHFHERSCVCK